MNKEILIETKNNYGKLVYYPACKTSELFARLCNTKTLTADSLRIIRALGYEVKISLGKNTGYIVTIPFKDLNV